jgi:two-component system alkaline phosphatase synthesis response regulator PhoP
MATDIRRVLVAEDNPAFSQVARFNLERAGYHVTLARNGREGWELLQKDRFDLVVTDEQMPEMNGRELCAKMRQTPVHMETPVIFLTAKKLELDARQLHEELGVARVFPKPFSPRELVDAIDEVLAPQQETRPS